MTTRNMPQVLDLFLDCIATPIGPIMIVADRAGVLREALFTDEEKLIHRQLRLHYGEAAFNLERSRNPSGLSDAILRYFGGKLDAIDCIPTETGGTPFQRQIWSALRDIPCGATTSYGELAKRIGHPAAVRAVGAANGANPIALVVPCHRVIGANGSLTGYGGGIERKRWLLDHERSTRLF